MYSYMYLYLCSTRRSPTDDKLYRVTEHDSGALHRSFAELNLFPDSAGDVVSRFRRDPSTTAWGMLSRVPHLLQRATNVLLFQPTASATQPTTASAAAGARVRNGTSSNASPNVSASGGAGVDLIGREAVAFRRQNSGNIATEAEAEKVTGNGNANGMALTRDDDGFELVTRPTLVRNTYEYCTRIFEVTSYTVCTYSLLYMYCTCTYTRLYCTQRNTRVQVNESLEK